jgi:hypothetical protein
LVFYTKGKHRLRLFGFRVPRRTKEVTRGCRKLHNKELHNLLPSPDNVRVIKPTMMNRVGHLAHMGETRNAYRILVGKLEGKRSF